MVPFAHLHVHSEYSLLDGACRIEQLVERVSDLGQTSCALTDHGVMYGVIDFYRACKAKGIHPVIGCEVYLAPHSRHERGYVNGEWHSHLILLCENMTGYKNLIHMVSAAFSEGFYMKPRIDMELLRGHSEGLICMSACLAGAIPRAIANGNMDKAYEICEEFLEIFDREHFYLEIQDHGIEEQKKVNEGLYQLAKELNLELVATNDAHYLTRADARTQDILMAIQMGKTVDDPTRMKFETQEFYIKDADEMAALFPEHPEALANTVKIAERCQVDFEFGKYHLPEFDVPEGYTSLEYLQKLCDEGFVRRYPDDDGTVRKRLQYEIDMIAKMGFVDYFLIVSDFIGYAKSQGIPVGRAAVRRQARSFPTVSASPTSTPSTIRCISNASSTRSAFPCRISTSTSATSAVPRSSNTSRASTARTVSRRSSRSARWPRAARSATSAVRSTSRTTTWTRLPSRCRTSCI